MTQIGFLDELARIETLAESQLDFGRIDITIADPDRTHTAELRAMGARVFAEHGHDGMNAIYARVGPHDPAVRAIARAALVAHWTGIGDWNKTIPL